MCMCWGLRLDSDECGWLVLVGEMDQWVKGFVAMPDHLSAIPRTHILIEKNQWTAVGDPLDSMAFMRP